ISLTVANLADEYFEIAVIPKTWEVTNLSRLRAGDAVNLEADVIAKYVERILTVGKAKADAGSGSSLTVERLAELGYN
ncbi:MAG: riboflavin synthase, partial [Pyrinomonadaceae bacterium]